MPTPQTGIIPSANTDALFIVFSINNAENPSSQRIKQSLSSVPELTQTLSDRHPDAHLTSTISIGSKAWEQLFPNKKPANLHPFIALEDGHRKAPATAGDLLLHIRSNRKDLNFELMQQVMALFDDTVKVEEEVYGFRYLDCRDLTGFVDGTENPEGDNRAAVAIVGEEDSDFAGGTYIHTQRYVHELKQWAQCPVHHQEAIIGRSKEENIEFSSDDKSPDAHIKRVNLKDADGKSMEILRHSMPYGDSKEAGLYFVSYCRTPVHFELMLEAMIHADSDGHYDHLMKFSNAVTGCAFFAPSIEFLESASN
ncbi:Dyp-type peroxidase [uncultured Endozoicomonas sp.]|uniref:Dyp-type peroxidase n=1 Tax=uncultured Endozoicomonas sp. TaxID=432652 RepID=UPI00260CA769|nr:Dyp-type peroxidase [uncultured Endozoicomonas sp.]